jgi:hypothetical protein
MNCPNSEGFCQLSAYRIDGCSRRHTHDRSESLTCSTALSAVGSSTLKAFNSAGRALPAGQHSTIECQHTASAPVSLAKQACATTN